MKTKQQHNTKAKTITKKKKSKGWAYVLLVLFGSVGAHRFYVGYVTSGIILLLLNIFAWILFFIALPFGWIALLLVIAVWLIVDLFTFFLAIEKINNDNL